jgi:cell division protein FtsB
VWPAVEVRMPMASRAARRPTRRASKRARRLSRPARALRWIGLVVLLAVAVGYVQPLRAYRDATADVAAQKAQIDRIQRTNAALEQRIEETETPEFVEREARKLGLVKAGERLFIVTGVDEWKHERRARARARLAG